VRKGPKSGRQSRQVIILKVKDSTSVSVCGSNSIGLFDLHQGSIVEDDWRVYDGRGIMQPSAYNTMFKGIVNSNPHSSP
jgi:hypothetical protein